MRLFLSSQDFGRHAATARYLAGDNPKALFFKNAQDDKPAAERNFSTPLKKQMFEAAGFEFEEIDLRNYFENREALRKKLEKVGSVWSSGGNTFILRRAMKASGLDILLSDLLREDRLLYGGWSAGACVTAPSLHGIEYGDRPSPDVVPESYPIQETMWEGLDLVPFMIVPHCDQEWFRADAERAIGYLAKAGVEYKTLDDGQVIIVDGEKVELLG